MALRICSGGSFSTCPAATAAASVPTVAVVWKMR